MTGMLRRRCGMIAIGALAVWTIVFPVFAEAPRTPDDQQIRSILEKSLSIVEIDKEIARIAEEQQQVDAKLESAEGALAVQEQKVNKQREDAGRIIRAYYSGDRNLLLTALLSTNSLSNLLTVLDYFDTIFAGDRQTLNDYTAEYRKLKDGIKELDKQSGELADIRTRLNTQRERVATLQQAVDSSVNGRSDADRLRQMIQEMTDFWQNVGLAEVRRYFKALDNAMGKLPQWIQDHKEMLQIDGFTYTLTIPDDKLNAFLREQNKLFDNFAFTFEPDAVIVSGKSSDLEVKLTGHYTIDKNGAILFHVDELLFNGLALPDTTRQSLEKEFDLGFYPQKIVSFLKTKSVQIEKGSLIVTFSISL